MADDVHRGHRVDAPDGLPQRRSAADPAQSQRPAEQAAAPDRTARAGAARPGRPGPPAATRSPARPPEYEAEANPSPGIWLEAFTKAVNGTRRTSTGSAQSRRSPANAGPTIRGRDLDVIQQRANMDWMLKELADGVPQIQQIVVLSADGLRIARHGGDPDVADRLAAACAGLQSLAAAVATEIPHGDGRMRLVVIEISGGFFYLMAAGAGAYLAVLADETVDAGLVGRTMRDMVVRIGAHLTSPPRHDGQAG